jgi:cytoskeletal protein CcmA (bactofilin family)
VTGSEDLLIQGEVDGSVTLEKHMVSVGSEGRVKADIIGRVITIEGRVQGDLTGQEQIILRGSAEVHGDIKSPRVVLEDGARFRGLVDMGATATGSASAPTTPAPEKSAGSASSDGAAATEMKGKDTASGASRAGA